MRDALFPIGMLIGFVLGLAVGVGPRHDMHRLELGATCVELPAPPVGNPAIRKDPP